MNLEWLDVGDTAVMQLPDSAASWKCDRSQTFQISKNFSKFNISLNMQADLAQLAENIDST